MYKTSEAISHQVNVDPAEQDDDVFAELVDLDCTMSVDGVEQQLRTCLFVSIGLSLDFARFRAHRLNCSSVFFFWASHAVLIDVHIVKSGG
jgi:hypothetical protein